MYRYWVRPAVFSYCLLVACLLLARPAAYGDDTVDPASKAPTSAGVDTTSDDAATDEPASDTAAERESDDVEPAETDSEDNAEEDNAEEDNAEEDNAEEDNAEEDSAEEDNAEEDAPDGDPAEELGGAAVENGSEGDSDGQAEADSQQVNKEYFELFKLFADTIDQIERNYVKPVDRRDLIEAAIRGLTTELDPYSNYIPPNDIEHFRSSIDSEFGGIGIQVTSERGQLTIISPLVGTPAYRGGLLAGDHIISIESETTEGMSLDEAVRRIKGKIGTEVSLTVRHTDGEEQTVALKREMIRIDTVLGDTRKDDDQWGFLLDEQEKLGYIRLTAFSRHTARELRRTLEQLQSKGCRGLVLDLRFNPGGLLSSAVEVSDMFVSSGVIVSTEGRNTQKRIWKAHQAGTFDGIPVTILVNRFSASASEILAACLQDHGRAIVIGERTWGKGSVQNVVELEDGKSALKLTTASYQRPSGKNIHRFHGASSDDEWGVSPDEGFLVDWDAQQTRAYLEYRRDRDIVLTQADAPDDQEPADATEDTEPAETGDSNQAPSPDESAPPSDKQNDTPPENTDPGDGDDAGSDGSDEGNEETEGQVDDGPFVDTQLQLALEYLRNHLAEVAQN